MEQYISKAALVAEIKKRINFNERLNAYPRLDECNEILSFIDTLEVKEVDLEKEMNEALTHLTDKDMRGWFRYFFELGLRTHKGE